MQKRLVVLLFLVASVVAHGQGKLPGYRSEYAFNLLGFPSVQQDLKLSPAVAKKIAAIQAESRKKFLLLIRPTVNNPNQVHQPSQQAIADQVKKTDMALLALLSTGQKARLKQIGYQYAGAFALLEPSTIKALNITPAQITKIRNAGDAAIRSFSKSIQPTSQPHSIVKQDTKATTRRLTEARLTMMKGLANATGKILTASQVTKWKAMQGKPFPISTLYAPVIGRSRA